jgi:GNAT superfamily N-acetyltransferase
VSDYYDVRRGSIADTIAAIGFAAGLLAATVMRWSILDVNFRYGNFARAVYDFAKTMLWWGIVGGVIGLGVGVIAARGWQRIHVEMRRRREITARSRLADGASKPGAGVEALPSAASGSQPITIAAAPASAGEPLAASPIRYDDTGFSAEAFLGLSRRVWPGAFDAVRSAHALERTANLGAWDGTRLVGAIRVLSDGYFYTAVPEILVDPEYRKRGIGRELMRRALALAPTGSLLISATSDSVGFFQRLGCSLAPMGFVMRTRASVTAVRRG